MGSQPTESGANPSYTMALSASEIERYRLMVEDAVEHEHEVWVAAGFSPGAEIADLGCGPGIVLLELAKLVGPSGTLIGMERDPHAWAAADGCRSPQGEVR